MTATTHTIYEQSQSQVLDYPVLENPTSDKPTSENPIQLNKDGLNTDSITILSPDLSPLSEPLPEQNGK